MKRSSMKRSSPKMSSLLREWSLAKDVTNVPDVVILI